MVHNRTPELLTDLESQIKTHLLPEMDAHRAHIISRKISQYLSHHWGGQLLYIPKNHGGQLDERDKQIYADFNGSNHAALAKKYDLAVQQIYKIIKIARQYDLTQRQQGLFDD